MRTLLAIACSCSLLSLGSAPAFAWGDEGHEVVALIADHYLQPGPRNKVRAMLAADTDSLTAHDIASEATWADKFRATPSGRERTSQWHFVDIELDHPDLDAACFGWPAIPNGTAASNGPAKDCVADKIVQFEAELTDTTTDPEERLTALKFLLHFVGDLHQPLHAADHNDRGGNEVRVSAAGFRAGNLHHFWDTVFVEQLGDNPAAIATDLIGRITDQNVAEWSTGTADAWAQESFALARDHAYGMLPAANSRGTHRLSDAYVEDATDVVATQLSKGGVRLAAVLNRAFTPR